MVAPSVLHVLQPSNHELQSAGTHTPFWSVWPGQSGFGSRGSRHDGSSGVAQNIYVHVITAPSVEHVLQPSYHERQPVGTHTPFWSVWPGQLAAAAAAAATRRILGEAIGAFIASATLFAT